MHIQLGYGLRQLELEVPAGCMVLPRQEDLPPPIEDPAAAIRAALEAPTRFPALRRALTPDDHVAIVVDEHLSQPGRLLVPIIEHVRSAQVPLETITLVCAPSARSQEWIDDLPEELLDVRLEVHAPGERRQLSFVATMKSGRRLYLNRTVADADQAIVLCGRGSCGGCLAGASLLFPELSDEATRRESIDKIAAHHGKSMAKETEEAIWLLGAPFFVHVIEGLGNAVAAVITGLAETGTEAQRLQQERWAVSVPQQVRTVVAGISGTPAGHDFGVLARAARTASQFVEAGGRLVLLTDAAPARGEAFDLLRQGETPEEGMSLLHKKHPPGWSNAQAWAQAAGRARLYLLSTLPAETVEDLYAVPIENPSQVARLLQGEGSCVFLRDAHKVQASS